MLLAILATIVFFISLCSRKIIFCTLTTIPERVDDGKLEKTLSSIRNQTLVPNYIILNVPKQTRAGKLYDFEKLDRLADKYCVFINIIEKDLGPITKIVPTLEFTKPESKIFIVDDDTIYDKNTLKTLYDSNLPAVGFYGRKNLQWFENTTSTPMKMDFLETYGGVLYDANLLIGLEAVFKCSSQDDIVIGKHLKNRGIDSFIINNSYIQTKSDGSGSPQLRDENLDGKGNEICYNYLFRNDAI